MMFMTLLLNPHQLCIVLTDCFVLSTADRFVLAQVKTLMYESDSHVHLQNAHFVTYVLG